MSTISFTIEIEFDNTIIDPRAEQAMDTKEPSLRVKRERETEAWIRANDASMIMMRIHELEDQIESYEAERQEER